MLIKKTMGASMLAVALPINQAIAATSALNNNLRIFEDTIWLITFTLMIIAGLLLRNLSGGFSSPGYILLAATGLLGWLWKGIGLVKRVFILNEPAWLFNVARETFEGLTGIVLALASILLVYSILKVYKARSV